MPRGKANRVEATNESSADNAVRGGGGGGGGTSAVFHNRLIGQFGGEELKLKLSKDLDPLQSIRDWRVNHGLDEEHFPRILPIMEFVDLLGAQRGDVYLRFARALRSKLLDSINALQPETKESDRALLLALLEKSFPYIRIEQVKSVFFAVIEKLPNPPKQYLSILGEHADFYQSCSLRVKRGIWRCNEEVLQSEIVDIVRRLVTDDDFRLSKFLNDELFGNIHNA